MNLVWIDLETTGTDPVLDPIVEVAVIVTDLNGQVEWDYQSVVYAPDAIERINANTYVKKMHTANGLYGQIMHPTSRRIGAIESEICSMLELGKGTLAGSGVAHFDHQFIKAQMPRLASNLNYYTMDVGIIRRFVQLTLGEKYVLEGTKDKNHRAMDDIKFHLDEYRHYQRLLREFAALQGFIK